MSGHADGQKMIEAPKWAPEPWQFNGVSNDGCPCNITATLSDGRYTAILIPAYDQLHHSEREWWWPVCVATTARAVACVNAMAGIPDPAAFVEEAKALRTQVADLTAQRDAAMVKRTRWIIWRTPEYNRTEDKS